MATGVPRLAAHTLSSPTASIDRPREATKWWSTPPAPVTPRGGLAARTAAGAILRLAGTGGCWVLLPGDQVATTVTDPTAAWYGVRRRLALLQPAGPAAGRGPLGAGGGPDLHVRAAKAPAEALGARPRPLPPGVVADADERAGP
jgi:hypothetical protein